MYIESTGLFIFTMLALYAAAAVISLLTSNKPVLSNYLPNVLSSAASALGVWLSVTYLLSRTPATFTTGMLSFIPNISFNFRMDMLSAFFILALSLLAFCVSIYSTGYLTHFYGRYNLGTFNFLYNIFILSMVLVFLSGNLVFFLIAWEVMALSSFFLVVFESGQPESGRSGIIYLIMTHLGTAFITIAFALMFKYTGSLSIDASLESLPSMVKNVIFICLLIGFGTKAGVIPLHVWLPHAHPAAPSNVSALMSGIMIKTAVYGLIRFILGSFGGGFKWWGMAVLAVGIISAILGVAYALIENNIKRMLAYSSIENVGIILMGLGVSFLAYSSGNIGLSALSATAALLHLFNHTLFKGLLFLGAGAVHYSTHTKNMEELGGLIKRMPYTGLFFLTASLSISALPPFNGFSGEWVTYQALFMNLTAGGVGVQLVTILAVAALAMTGALAAACFVKSFGISFLGLPRSERAKEAKEVPVPMLTSMGLLSFLCLAFGLLPTVVIRLLDAVCSAFGKFASSNEAYALTGSMKGSLSFIYYPMAIGKNSISPLVLAAAGLAILLLVLLVVRLVVGKTSSRKYGTWDCGFITLTPKMQYSGTGFSKPLRIVLRGIYRPTRELQVEQGPSRYYHKSMKYIVSTRSVFEETIYRPITELYTRFSRKFRLFFQTGSVHTYLIYIFVTILVLLLYNRLN